MAKFTCSDKVWFPDGNLVLEAENTRFRVYQGVLVKNSPIFADVMSIPQPENPEQHEGVPLVCLPDSAEELSYFLMALFSEYKITKWEFPAIAGIINLSLKYDIPDLRRRAMDYLADIYPSTLAVWDFHNPKPKSDSTPNLAFKALSFARRVNLTQMLPVAFYECCILPQQQFLEGIMWASGECAALTQDDLLACLTGREKLRHATQFKIFSFAYEPSHYACTNQKNCPPYRLRWLEESNVLPASGWDPLSMGVTWGEYRDRVCSYCHLLGKDTYDSEREKLWEDLPSYFGLPSWANLLGTTT